MIGTEFFPGALGSSAKVRVSEEGDVEVTEMK